MIPSKHTFAGVPVTPLGRDKEMYPLVPTFTRQGLVLILTCTLPRKGDDGLYPEGSKPISSRFECEFGLFKYPASCKPIGVCRTTADPVAHELRPPMVAHSLSDGPETLIHPWTPLDE